MKTKTTTFTAFALIAAIMMMLTPSTTPSQHYQSEWTFISPGQEASFSHDLGTLPQFVEVNVSPMREASTEPTSDPTAANSLSSSGGGISGFFADNADPELVQQTTLSSTYMVPYHDYQEGCLSVTLVNSSTLVVYSNCYQQELIQVQAVLFP